MSDFTADFVGIGAARGGGGGGGAGATGFVFRPGGIRQGGIFPTWPELAIEIAQTDGPIVLQIDNSLAAAVIPAGGPYDLRDVTLEGGDKGGGSFLTIAEGAIITGLRNIRKNLFIDCAATTTPPITDLVTGDVVTLHDGCDVASSGGIPLFRASGLTAGQSILLFIDTVSTFGLFSATPVLDMPVAGTFLIGFYGEGGGANNGTLTGAIGAVHIPSYASPGASIGLNPGFLGTTSTPFSFAQTRYNLNPQPPAAALTAPGTLDHDQLGLFDVSGGGFTQPLPLAAGTFALLHGSRICITETTGSSGLLVAPAGGDTINGSATPVSVLGGGSIVLISDGIDNWTIQSRIVQSIFSPPEKWGLSNIAAGGAAQSMSALVSTEFDNVEAIRPGSIIGMSSRFILSITDAAADSAIVEVTINGAPGVLQVSSSSGVNPLGGKAVQGAGIDTYVAGDKLGFRVRTKGTFLPLLNACESWLECTEDQ